MSLGSAGAASVGGMWDVFDRCVAVINYQIARLSELDHEEAALAELDNIRLLCQRVEAAIP